MLNRALLIPFSIRELIREPMKFPLLLSLLLAVFFRLEAQNRKIELHDGLEEIKGFKTLVFTFDCKQGEEILFDVESVNRRRLRRIEIVEPGSDMIHYAKRKHVIQRKRIPVQREGVYTFNFVNRGLLKRSYNIKIYKRGKAELRDTMFLDDIRVSSSFDTLEKPYIDTIPFPDVSTHEFTLAPTVDIARLRDSCLFEELLGEEDLGEESEQFAVYWIGVGPGAAKAYEDLKTEPPIAWSFRGVSEPLIAYALGLTKTLPESRTTLRRSLAFKFANPNKDGNLRLKITDNRTPFYGFIPMDKAGKYKRLRLCLSNLNANTAVPITVKVAKFKVEKGLRYEYYIRERVQEVYTKEKIELND